VKIVAVIGLSVLLVAGCSSGKASQSQQSSAPSQQPAATSEKHGWTEDEVNFVADGLTIYGTYRHNPDAGSAPAALLISESGRTDRNGDNAVAGPVGNMRQLAEYLSGRNIASLRYDKIGTGKTGLGPYQQHPADVGSAVYTTGAEAGLRYLADQPGVEKAKLSVYALGEGTIHAMALASDTAAGAPKVHSLALLQPLPGRYLDIISGKLEDDNWSRGCLVGDLSLEASSQSEMRRQLRSAARIFSALSASTSGFSIPPVCGFRGMPSKRGMTCTCR